MGNLEDIARAYLTRERYKLGIPQREQAAAESQAKVGGSLQDQALRALQVKQAQHALDIAPQLETQAKNLNEAQVRNLDEPNRAAATATHTQYITDSRTGQVTAVERQPDGSYKETQLSGRGKKDKPPSAGAGQPKRGAGSDIIDKSGKPGKFFAGTGEFVPLPEGAAFASDARTARKEAVTATGPIKTVETLAGQVDNALKDVESTSLLHPIDAAVAQSSYKNLLSALSVPWGRLLGDSRISDQDRAAYSRSVGEPDFFLKQIAPDVARQRLTNLHAVLDDIKAKYGPILEGTEGMLGPAGKPAASGGGFEVVGMRPE